MSGAVLLSGAVRGAEPAPEDRHDLRGWGACEDCGAGPLDQCADACPAGWGAEAEPSPTAFLCPICRADGWCDCDDTPPRMPF